MTAHNNSGFSTHSGFEWGFDVLARATRQAVSRTVRATTKKGNLSMAKTLRSRIAAVAVAALGAGLLTAAPASAGTVSATLAGPVRVSFTGTARDAVPAQGFKFTPDAAVAKAETNDVILTVVSAPTTNAQVSVTVLGATVSDTLDGAGTQSSNTDLSAAIVSGTAVSGTISVGTNPAAGTYSGTLVFREAADSDITVNWSFTTTGAPTAWTVAQTASALALSGTDTVTVTLKDAAGKTTQPSTVDSLTLSTTAGTFTDGTDTTVTATELAAGTIDLTFTAPGSAAVVTAKVTPNGVLPAAGFTSSSLTYTVSGTVNTTAITQANLYVEAPAYAISSGTYAGGNAAIAVPANTSSVTVGFDATASSTYRFKVVGTAGTVNGATATTAQYLTVKTDADGYGTFTLALGAGAGVEGTSVNIKQVTSSNTTVQSSGSDVSVSITQTAAAISGSTVKQSPTGALVRALGVSTDVTVSVADQFKRAMGAGYTVRAYRSSVSAANLLGSAVTAADGTAKVTITPKSTVVSGGTETYYFTVSGTSLAETTSSTTITVTYTTDGAITGLSVSVSNTTGSTSPLAAATTLTAATTQSVYPAILVPTDGKANVVSGERTYDPTTGTFSGATGAELLTLTADATADNSSDVTVSAGAFLYKTSSVAWNAGLSSLTVSDNTAFYVFATKTGLHTVTIKSANLTREVKFYAYNASTDYYTVSVDAATASIASGEYKVFTVSVKDIFGNAVKTAADALTAKATGSVLLGGLASSATYGTGSDGTVSITVIGNNTAGTGTFSVSGPAAGAFAADYVAPTGAGTPAKSVTATVTVKAADTSAIDAIKAQVAALGTTITSIQTAISTLVASTTATLTLIQSQLNKIMKKLKI